MNDFKVDVLPRGKDGSHYKDLLEDMKTLKDISHQAYKWKHDNGQPTNNQNENKDRPNIPPPLGTAGDVNINTDAQLT